MKLGDKIKKLRKEKRMTQADLSKKLKVAPTSVSSWERNENNPLMDKITIMSKLFDVPISYFFDSDVIKEEPAEYIVGVNNADAVDLPIVGRISCGNGVVAFHDVEGYESIPVDWVTGGEYFFLRAKGDSMINARILDGDLLLIRKQEDVENGEIAAILIEEDAVLKRVYKTGNNTILQSENPKYPPILLDKSKNIRIIGKLKRNVIKF
ncbi:helix-turn-helix domain-containing protein [Bacillaceae bacterium Marseille-Q3522]|nr:helix-turn-helix domain-containing protein [Bacillaceae bacterium Marseille-Q3522]